MDLSLLQFNNAVNELSIFLWINKRENIFSHSCLQKVKYQIAQTFQLLSCETFRKMVKTWRECFCLKRTRCREWETAPDEV